ncbi:hypothetical protein KUCAC02_029588, partial [Chaenocephalus aceratus]
WRNIAEDFHSPSQASRAIHHGHNNNGKRPWGVFRPEFYPRKRRGEATTSVDLTNPGGAYTGKCNEVIHASEGEENNTLTPMLETSGVGDRKQ